MHVRAVSSACSKADLGRSPSVVERGLWYRDAGDRSRDRIRSNKRRRRANDWRRDGCSESVQKLSETCSPRARRATIGAVRSRVDPRAAS